MHLETLMGSRYAPLFSFAPAPAASLEGAGCYKLKFYFNLSEASRKGGTTREIEGAFVWGTCYDVHIVTGLKVNIM